MNLIGFLLPCHLIQGRGPRHGVNALEDLPSLDLVAAVNYQMLDICINPERLGNKYLAEAAGSAGAAGDQDAGA